MIRPDQKDKQYSGISDPLMPEGITIRRVEGKDLSEIKDIADKNMRTFLLCSCQDREANCARAKDNDLIAK